LGERSLADDVVIVGVMRGAQIGRAPALDAMSRKDVPFCLFLQLFHEEL